VRYPRMLNPERYQIKPKEIFIEAL